MFIFYGRVTIGYK